MSKFKSARVATHEVASVPVTPKTEPYIAPVAKAARDEGLPPDEVRAELVALDDETPEFEALQRAEARVREITEGANKIVEERERAHDLAKDYAEKFAKKEALDSARKTAADDIADATRDRDRAMRTWRYACRRNEEKREIVGHIDYLRAVLAGEQTIETAYRSNVGSYEHKTVDLCRWLATAPFGVVAILASEAIDAGQLPYAERVAAARAEYLRADEYRIACNRDRNALPHVTFGLVTTQLEVDQVSQEQLDAKCAELGRVPSNDEIRAMFRGPGKEERYFAEAAAAEEARRNSPATKKLQQSVRELLARNNKV